MSALQDKRAIVHAFASLMKNPHLIDSTENYRLHIDDFPEKFHKIIFAAITNLHESGIEKITPIAIDGYLSSFPVQHRIFNDNEGFEYLSTTEEIGEPENYVYYLNRIKKYSFLRTCIDLKIDIAEIYDESLVDVSEIEKQQNEFDEYTLEELIEYVEGKLIRLKDDFLYESVSVGSHMSDDIDDMIDELSLTPNYGYNTPSKYLNSVARGMRLRKLFCFSGNTGSGKTRSLLSMIMTACTPEIYDSEKKQWIKTGANGRGLFISTELEDVEIKIPALCFIADIEEHKVHDATLTQDEVQRLQRAKEILKETPVWFEELHDFDLEDLEHVIAKNIYSHKVDVVAFDYMHTTLKLFEYMAQRGAKNLREDQVLRLMSIRLKMMCNKYNVWIGTATQLNENYKDEGNKNLDQSAIQGSKSVADKFDFGVIQIPLRKRDEEVVREVSSIASENGIKTFGITPTHTMNVYKNRGNRFKMIRIFIDFNMGTLRMKDIFVTDYNDELFTKVKPITIENVTEEVEQDALPDSFYEDDQNTVGNFSF